MSKTLTLGASGPLLRTYGSVEDPPWYGPFSSPSLTTRPPFTSAGLCSRIPLPTQPSTSLFQCKTDFWVEPVQTASPSEMMTAWACLFMCTEPHPIKWSSRDLNPSLAWVSITGLYLQSPHIPVNNATQHQVCMYITPTAPLWTLNSQDMSWHTQGTQLKLAACRVTGFYIVNITLRFLSFLSFLFFRKPILSFCCMVKAVWANTTDSCMLRPDIYWGSSLPFDPSSHRSKKCLWLFHLFDFLFVVRKE